MLHKAIESQRVSGNPVRIILLKPRQVGWSTWCEAECFCYINRNANKKALVISADNKSTNFVFRMTKLFQDEMPKDIKRRTVSSTQYAIFYASPHRSQFLTQTAGQDVLGRGGTINYLHLSEFAYWPAAKSGFAAVSQMVPVDTDTLVVIESTANGVGGAFYDMFWEAVDRQRKQGGFSGYIPLFFPWYQFDEYRLAPPTGFRLEEPEEELKAKFGFDDAQIYWRRLKVQESGLEFFRQEYPATPMEAFVTSGNPVFSEKVLKQSVTDNVRRVIFNDEGKIEDVNRNFNCWKIFRLPVKGHEYTMGGDTMESRLSDVKDEKSSLDRDGIVIYDRDENQFVAIYHGQTEQHDLGLQCLHAARFYNEPWVAPEIPHGMEVLKIFRNAGYQNIYQRQVKEQQYDVDESDNLGWRTTLANRKNLVDSFITALDEGLRVNFSDVLDEMQSFIYDKNGKPVHMPGKHDDLVFGAMIAFRCHLDCPYKPKPYSFSHTGDYEEKPKGDLRYEGAVDEGVEEDEELEALYTV